MQQKKAKDFEQMKENEIKKISSEYNQIIDSLKLKLNEANEKIENESLKRQQIQDDLKKAFMRGVCALNFEAMNVFQSENKKEDCKNINMPSSNHLLPNNKFSSESQMKLNPINQLCQNFDAQLENIQKYENQRQTPFSELPSYNVNNLTLWNCQVPEMPCHNVGNEAFNRLNINVMNGNAISDNSGLNNSLNERSNEDNEIYPNLQAPVPEIVIKSGNPLIVKSKVTEIVSNIINPGFEGEGKVIRVNNGSKINSKRDNRMTANNGMNKIKNNKGAKK